MIPTDRDYDQIVDNMIRNWWQNRGGTPAAKSKGYTLSFYAKGDVPTTAYDHRFDMGQGWNRYTKSITEAEKNDLSWLPWGEIYNAQVEYTA